MSLTRLISNSFKYHISNLHICFPAVVVGIDDIEDNMIDIQPVLNNLKADGTDDEEPVIYSVPICNINTQTSSITIPVNIGDGVLVVSTDKDPTTYFDGSKEPHAPASPTLYSSGNCVAIVGCNPFQDSPYNANNYSNQFDRNSLNLIHNKNTENEVTFSLTQDGKVSCIAPNGVSVKTTVADVEADLITTNALVETSNDVTIKGLSVYQHMTTHTHPYTDDSNPMTTGVPNN